MVIAQQYGLVTASCIACGCIGSLTQQPLVVSYDQMADVDRKISGRITASYKLIIPKADTLVQSNTCLARKHEASNARMLVLHLTPPY